MTKRKLRKNADISPPQSPHDGIHTCSKGCSKPGCTRTLRDTIEEQDQQIEALKRDVLASLRVDVGKLHAQFNRALFDETVAENARLKAEVELLREAGDEVVSRIQVCTEDLWCSIHRWNAAREGKQP